MNDKQKDLLRKLMVAVFFFAVLSLIIYKSIYLPITFDEKAAAVYYPAFSVIEIIKYPGNWPSNHILNTLCIKLSESIFGIEPWSVRLPNIIAFVFFYLILYLLAIRYFRQSFFLFFLPFAIIFCNSYLLDFYGLARGYGISNALMAASVYCLLRYAQSLRLSWYYLTIVLSMLAAYANFTLLIFWAAVHALLLLLSMLHYIRDKKFLSLAYVCLSTGILALAFIALCYTPLYKMQSTNQFVYWSKNGFFTDTLMDQVHRFKFYVNLGSKSDVAGSYGVLLLLAFTAVYVFRKVRRNGMAILSDPLVIVFVLLIMVWVVNMCQVIILGSPYLNGRTALSYYVLFGFVMMFFLRDASQRHEWISHYAAPCILILLLINLSLSIRLHTVLDWWFDANTYEVLHYLDRYRNDHPEAKSIDLNTTWIFHPSFSFYSITGKVPWLKVKDIHTDVDTVSQTLFYYANKEDADHLKGYEKVLSFEYGGRVLLRRK